MKLELTLEELIFNMYEPLSVKTKLGDVSFGVTAKIGDLSRAKIRSKEISPKLPKGMNVERVTIVLLTMPAVEPIENLKFTCKLSEYFPKGEPCTGEALDAWEWESQGRLVVIGTEDGEWLESRLKLEEVTQENYPIHYANNEITIEIDKYTRDEELSLHFVVSENNYPEEKDCSCWFSVDIPHDRLVEEFNRS